MKRWWILQYQNRIEKWIICVRAVFDQVAQALFRFNSTILITCGTTWVEFGANCEGQNCCCCHWLHGDNLKSILVQSNFINCWWWRYKITQTLKFKMGEVSRINKSMTNMGHCNPKEFVINWFSHNDRGCSLSHIRLDNHTCPKHRYSRTTCQHHMNFGCKWYGVKFF